MMQQSINYKNIMPEGIVDLTQSLNRIDRTILDIAQQKCSGSNTEPEEFEELSVHQLADKKLKLHLFREGAVFEYIIKISGGLKKTSIAINPEELSLPEDYKSALEDLGAKHRFPGVGSYLKNEAARISNALRDLKARHYSADDNDAIAKDKKIWISESKVSEFQEELAVLQRFADEVRDRIIQQYPEAIQNCLSNYAEYLNSVGCDEYHLQLFLEKISEQIPDSSYLKNSFKIVAYSRKIPSLEEISREELEIAQAENKLREERVKEQHLLVEERNLLESEEKRLALERMTLEEAKKEATAIRESIAVHTDRVNDFILGVFHEHLESLQEIDPKQVRRQGYDKMRTILRILEKLDAVNSSNEIIKDFEEVHRFFSENSVNSETKENFHKKLADLSASIGDRLKVVKEQDSFGGESFDDQVLSNI